MANGNYGGWKPRSEQPPTSPPPPPLVATPPVAAAPDLGPSSSAPVTTYAATGADDAMKAWRIKLGVCMVIDFLDFTIGRTLFFIPFSGEVVGGAACFLMFGKTGLLYGAESVDFTEQLDGFVPAATLVALANRPR